MDSKKRLKLATLNVAGLNKPLKRRRLRKMIKIEKWNSMFPRNPFKKSRRKILARNTLG